MPMTPEQKKELGLEILKNMDLTKEQYLSMCGLIDDLDLEKGAVEIVEEEKEDTWEDIEKAMNKK